MKTILITGGAGYIGSQTVYTCLDNGFNVVVIDNLSTGNLKTLEKAKDRIKFYNADLNDDNQVDKIFKQNKIDAVIHFAASPAIVSQNPQDVPLYFESNLRGTISLIETMRKNSVRNLVFSSTAATYGVPDSIPINEDQTQNPINSYGVSKLMCENIFKEYVKAGLLNVFALRYFNACGADSLGRTGEMHNPETHLIPIVIQAALGQREKIVIFGKDYKTKDGTCVRDYVHTEDLANAHIKAINFLEKQANTTFEYTNLGSKNGYSNLEIIEKVKEISGTNFKVEKGERRLGDPDILIADNSKAKKILNWKAQKDLNEIIKTAYDWHKNQS